MSLVLQNVLAFYRTYVQYTYVILEGNVRSHLEIFH